MPKAMQNNTCKCKISAQKLEVEREYLPTCWAPHPKNVGIFNVNAFSKPVSTSVGQTHLSVKQEMEN